MKGIKIIKNATIYKWFGYLCLGVTTNGRDMTSVNLDDELIEMLSGVLHEYRIKNKGGEA